MGGTEVECRLLKSKAAASESIGGKGILLNALIDELHTGLNCLLDLHIGPWNFVQVSKN